MDLLSKVDDFQTTCLIKGAASYFDLKLDGEDIANAAWSYEAPLPANEKKSKNILPLT